MRITHIGGPTTLIELDGLCLLTDPTFDAPGRTYKFGWGSSSRKLAGPAVAVADLPPIDAILLTHDHHADNLDDAGRALLGTGPVTVTTIPGAIRIGRGAVGLAAGQSAPLPGGWEVLATPARHGPPLSRAFVGDVIGFALRRPGQRECPLWISGDTVLYAGLRQVAQRLSVDVAVLHLGQVQFGNTGPVRYTMSARDAVELCARVKPRTVLPVHYEGWRHFREGRPGIETAFAAAPEPIRNSLRWLPIGQPTTI